MVKRVSVLLFTFLFSLSVYAQFTNVTVGSSANDGTGDSLRLSFQKLNYADNWLNTNLTTVSNLAVSGGSAAAKMNTNAGTSYSQILIGPSADGLTVNDSAYASGWNASTNVPTRNAIFDKIESTYVDSIQALRDLDATAFNFRYVYVGGYSSRSDGGQGWFYWLAGNATATNRGTVFEPTAGTSGRWLRIYNTGGDINAKWFGVKGDGSTDDQAALSNAAAIAAAVGGTLVIPYTSSGYRIRSALTFSTGNLRVRGEGGYPRLYYDPATETTTFIVVQADGVRFSNIDFDGNSKTLTVVRVDNQSSGSDDIVFDGCTFRNGIANDVNDVGATATASGLGIFRSCDRVTVRNCIFSGTTHVSSGVERVSGSISISDTGYTTTADKVQDIKIIDCFFKDGGASTAEFSHIRLNTQYTEADGYDVGLLVSGNHFHSFNKRAGKFIGNGGVVSGNFYFSDSPDAATVVYSANSYYGRNWIDADNVYSGIFPDKVVEIGAGNSGPEIVRNVQVKNATFLMTGASAASAVRVSSSTAGIQIDGVRGENVTYGVYAVGNIKNLQIDNVGLTNVATAGVLIASDGSNAPERVQIDNVLQIGGAGNAVTITAVTNLSLGKVIGTVAVSGATGTRTLEYDVTASVTGPLSTSDELASILTDETGSAGGFVRATSPTFVTPALGVASATGRAYNATDWNGSARVPTEDDIRDKIESMGAGSGDVVGPSSAVDNGVAVYDSTTGKLIKDGSGALRISGTNTLALGDFFGNSITLTNGLNIGAAGTAGAIALWDTDASHHFRIQAAGTITTSINLIPDTAPGGGFWFGTVSGTTNETITHVTATGSGSVVRATSPTLVTPEIGAATATTPAENDNDTSVATTAYVQTEIAGLGGSSFNPSTGPGPLFDEFWSDSVPAYPWTISNSGAGADVAKFAAAESNRPGVIAFKAGTTTTGRASIYTSRDGMFLSGGAVTWEAWVKIPVLSDGTDEYDFFIGMGDNRDAIAQTDGIIFSYDRNASTNWRLTAYKAGATSGAVDLGSAVAADTWVKLGFTVNAGATSVQGYVNGASAGTPITTNIPDTVSNLMAAAMATIVKSAGTTDRTARVDYIWVTQTFTTPR